MVVASVRAEGVPSLGLPGTGQGTRHAPTKNPGCARRSGGLLLAATSPAIAIIDGTTDTTGRFPNVGGLQLRLDGEWFDFCTGTLVAPNVVLTAAHCTSFFTGEVGDEDELGPDDWRISFEADLATARRTTARTTSSFTRLARQRGRTGRRQLENVIPQGRPGGHRAGLSHRGGRRRDSGSGGRRWLPGRARPDQRDVHGGRLWHRRICHWQRRVANGDHGVRRGPQLQGCLGDHKPGPVPRTGS